MYGQAAENTLDSLRHGINFLDGIEFDIRMTSDKQLIVHHDSTVSIPQNCLQGKTKWVEGWSLEDLQAQGFASFREMLEDPIIHDNWQQKGKMGCIEIKRPHPTAPMGGGYFSRKKHNKHIANIIKKADQLLDEFEIPKQNMVYYSFHRGMKSSSKSSKTQRPWAALIPYIAPYGNRTSQRMQSLPSFLTTSFAALRKQHSDMGGAMLPCAIEYFVAPHNKYPVGKTVGFHGQPLRNLNNSRKDMPVYVWPCKPFHEKHLFNAGLTGLTDNADPHFSWLPSGHARWVNPATQPLDQQQLQLLNSATEEDHKAILAQLQSEVPLWSQCDSARRKELVSMWKQKWNWQKSVDEIVASANDSSPLAQMPRLIGHRGSGKTARPVIQD